MVTNATDFYPNGSIAYENAQQLSDILEDYKRAHQSLYHSAPHSPKMAPTGDAYSGLSFQQAQEKIVEDTINYREDPNDEMAAFEDFIDLPPRALKDYYEAIKHPISLKLLLKSVKGTRSKSSSPGISAFKTWAAFEEEFSYIWENTFTYNRDDSLIYARGKELETFVKKALKEAKQAVPDSTAQSAGLKIKLKVTRKSSPRDSPAPQAGGPSGSTAPSTGTNRSKVLDSETPTSGVDQPEGAKSMIDSVSSPAPSNAAATKHEEAGGTTPGYQTASQAVSTPGLNGSAMPPPSTLGLTAQHTQSGYAQLSHHGSQSEGLVNPLAMDFDPRFRFPGETVEDALVKNVVITTHPALNITPVTHDLKASSYKREPNFAFHLPEEHYLIQIKPVLANNLIDRQHKMWVAFEFQSLQAMSMIPGHPVDPLNPLFEVRLQPGVNRIEISIAAAPRPGIPRPAGAPDFDAEKWLIFPNLLRS